MLARDRVTKVREFQQLARLSEADGHLQQRLKQLLKLSKEKWDAACEHAKTAVQARARAVRGQLCRAESRGSGPGRVSPRACDLVCWNCRLSAPSGPQGPSLCTWCACV
jgi:hypothetical protein